MADATQTILDIANMTATKQPIIAKIAIWYQNLQGKTKISSFASYPWQILGSID